MTDRSKPGDDDDARLQLPVLTYLSLPLVWSWSAVQFEVARWMIVWVGALRPLELKKITNRKQVNFG